MLGHTTRRDGRSEAATATGTPTGAGTPTGTPTGGGTPTGTPTGGGTDGSGNGDGRGNGNGNGNGDGGGNGAQYRDPSAYVVGPLCHFPWPAPPQRARSPPRQALPIGRA